MLQATKLWFRYSKAEPWILQGHGLTLHRGEVLGLRGLSGVGKSTLASVLSGYLKPDSGEVLVDGMPLKQQGYRSVQLVFSHPELTINPHFRIAKALEESGSKCDEMLEALAIDPSWLCRFAHELSGGELQRIALARALGQGTAYLIADEMTAMLDPVVQASLWRFILQRVEQRQLGVLAISHDEALLGRVAHRTVEIDSLRTDTTAGSVSSR